jgi:hypothetical protein
MFNELNKEDITPEVIEFLHKNAMQRAALLALITKLMEEENESLTIHNVKICIANFFSKLIDDQNLVMDMSERYVFEVIMTFVQQENLIEQFREI